MNGLTAPCRSLPDFIIIGALKCGTTSLYTYINEHPCSLPALKKETHFFSEQFHRGLTWYRRNFPLEIEKRLKQSLHGNNCVTGESTPRYLVISEMPKRIFRALPDVKLIVMLRNPVDRAYSHYQQLFRIGKEHLTFEQALEKDAERQAGIYDSLPNPIDGGQYSHLFHTYLYNGHYAELILPWLQYFPIEQFLFIQSERLFENPDNVLQEVFQFLGVPKWHLPDYKTYAKGSYSSKLSLEMRARLGEYFAPYNAQLQQITGVSFPWE